MALIEIRALSKLYRMGTSIVRALDGVDLTIERGEFIAITGASGSGKSTMMHLIGCLDRPTAGVFILNGQNVGEMSDRQLADVRNREIGFVFQTFNLINRTSAAENVAVPLFYARKAATRGPALAALERVGLGPRSHHNPNELSGGERQRVAIARAIVNNPPVVLADEPTGNLDTRTGEQIMEIFHDLNRQGVTIILVTHEYDVAVQARRIVHMRDGKILWDRPTAEVKSGDFVLRPKGTEQTGFSPDFFGPAAGGTSAARSPAATAVLEAPPRVAAQPVPRAAPAPAAPYPVGVAARPKLRPGAKASLICGITNVTLYVAGVLVLVALTWGIDWSKWPKEPGQQPPPELMKYMPRVAIGSGVLMLTVIAGMIVGVVGIVLGRKALRFTPLDNAPMRGRGMALAGLIISSLAAAAPLLWVIFGILMFVVKGSKSTS